jgi:transcriptional regulator with XRE-family HTH domain
LKNREKHNVGIGKRIKQARMNAKISGTDLSKKMQLSRSMCSQWECGVANPSTAHLVKLAKILKVSFEWLALGEAENPAKDNELTDIIAKLNIQQKQHLKQFIKSMN